MPYTSKKLDDSQIEFTITVTPEEYKKNLEKAATKISDRVAIKGFRKGKAPYDMVVKEVGEMAILQEAVEEIVQETFFNALKKEELETIGMPKIDIEKLAPGNDIVYRANVALFPGVKLADISKIKVKTSKKNIEDKQVNETLDALRGMHATEVLKTGVADGTDKLVLDMDMALDKVPVEGGQAKDYQVYLSEDHYIPGFNDHVRGLKKDDEKEFTLDFPKTHYQKHLAGKTVDVKVKVKEVYERQLPEMDEEFAKKLGQESVEKLRDLIQNNLLREAERKADQSAEIEMLDKLVEKSTFDPIPKVITDAEKQKMFYELKQDLEKNGITIDQYLQDIKKDEKTLFEEFGAQAEKRAKAALISRQVAKAQNIEISSEEIDKEITMMKDVYKEDKEVMEKIGRPEVRDTIATNLQNKKVMTWLKEQIIEEEKVEAKK